MHVRKVIRVFLGSPGDLPAERQAAKSVCDELNALWADETGYQIDLVGWEDTVAAFGRAQSLINRELTTCELFIGMLWKKWGTPPALDGKYKSGFEEEFSITVERIEAGEEVGMSLFLRDIDDESKRDPGEQLKLVLDFRKRLEDEKKIYFETFSDVTDYSNKLRRLLTKYIQEKRRKEVDRNVKEQAPVNSYSEQDQINSHFDGQTKDYQISELILKHLKETAAGGKKLDAVEVARIRLLASVSYTGHNDRSYVKPHDANLLYADKGRDEYSDLEVGALLVAGLRTIDDENVPLWHWYSRLNKDALYNPLLAGSAFFSVSKTRIGALTAATMLRLKPIIPSDKTDETLEKWSTAPNDVKSAVIKYLKFCGSIDLLPWLQAELDKDDGSTQLIIINAIAFIKARLSKDEALKFIIDANPSKVEQETLSEVFGSDNDIAVDTLMTGLQCRASELRRACLSALLKRRALSNDDVRALLDDESIEVRFEAACALAQLGQQVSQEIAKEKLTKPSGSRGMFALGFNETEWLDRYELYKHEVEPLEDLRKKVKEETFYNVKAFNALARRDFSALSEQLRTRLEDRFEAYHQHYLTILERLPGGEELIRKNLSIKNSVVNRHLLSTLLVLVDKGGVQDLELVKRVAGEEAITPFPALFSFVGKHGSEGDIDWALIASERATGSDFEAVKPFKRDQVLQSAASALIALAGKNYLSLITKVHGSSVEPYVLANFTKTMWSRVPEQVSDKLLVHDDDTVRKVACLKTLSFMSTEKVQAALARHTKPGSTIFYNVVFWLDAKKSLGNSAKALADRQLKPWIDSGE